MKHLISIIVPVYNVENYIHQCLDSIINQSYSNLEIILVDDGTKDNCGEICDELAKVDQRVKVIHKENGGLSSARNSGIAAAKGDYIIFIDSDDWIELDYVEKLHYYITKYNADISVCGVKKVWDDGTNCKMTNFKNLAQLNRNEAMSALIHESNLNVAVWNKLYKKDILNGISFANGKINEDVDWTWKIIARCNHVVVFDDLLYNYRQRNGSIMSVRASSNFKFVIDCMLERHECIKAEYSNLVNDSALSILYTCVYQGQIYLKAHKFHERSVCFSYLQNVLRSIELSNDYLNSLSITKKIRLYMIKNHILLNCLIQNLFHIGI